MLTYEGAGLPSLIAVSISGDALKKPLRQITIVDTSKATVADMPASGP